MVEFVKRHEEKLQGVLSCFDRVVITGTLPDIGHAQAMSRELTRRGIRIFGFARFSEPLKDEVRANAERLATEAGFTVDYIVRKNFRKDERIKEILEERGTHPGLVHVFSAMEPCTSFRPWHDKPSGETFLKYRDAKCIHYYYYFYFIDPEFGLCYLRVPTCAPFRLQFCVNGHNWLARRLEMAGIGYTLLENAFVWIEDVERAQELADDLSPKRLHRRLDALARLYCPVLRHFASGYHWSLTEIEYATDLLFRRPDQLRPLYDALLRAAVQAVRVEQVAHFLGKKLTGRYGGELTTDLSRRIEGSRLRHQMGPSALKLYDKLGRVLRVETTTNDVTFFRHHREVEHRDGTRERKVAPMKKSIYSLPALRRLMHGSNRWYLEFLSTLNDVSTGTRSLLKVAAPIRQKGRSYRGFDFLHGEDLEVLRSIVRGEFNVRGFQNKDLRTLLPHLNPRQVSRILKRLRVHGLIKRVAHSYRYYLTRLGRRAVAAALHLRELVLVPALADRPAVA